MVAKTLDLDAIAKEQEFTIKLNGKKHILKPVTVADFAETMKLFQSLGVDASIADEIELMRKIILKSFPTLTEADIESLTLVQMKAIADHAQLGNSTVVSAEKADAEGNE